MKVLKILLSIIFVSTITTSCSNLDVQLLNKKAVELRNAGDLDGAIARLESINDLNPNHSQVHFNLGVAYYEKEELEKAIVELNKAIDLKRDFSDAYYTLGVIYETMALNIIDENIEEKNLSDKIKSSISDNFIKSAEAFEKYIAISPEAGNAKDIEYKINQLKSDIKKYKLEDMDIE